MTRPASKASLSLLLIAYLGFVSLGLPDTVIGVAWPSVRDSFGRRQSELGFIFFGAGLSYFLSSFFAGTWLRRFGVGGLLAVSSVLVCSSSVGYGLAAVWVLFAACSLLHGLGSGAIDAGLNHYVASHFSARHMNWLHGSYSVGAMLGPLIMTAVLALGTTWRTGYLSVGIILGTLSLLFLATRQRWDEPGNPATAEPVPVAAAPLRDALRHPLVGFQALLFFIYTGLELTVGQWSFTILTEGRGVTRMAAGGWVTAYWASIGVGRFLFGFVVERVGADRLLRVSMLGVLVGTALFAGGGPTAVSGIALGMAGLGMAAIYPCLMARTPQRLGKALAAHAVGFQVSAATLGGAALPTLAGYFGQETNLELIGVWAVALALVLFLLHEGLLRTTQSRSEA